jgi:serine/threonine protein kinase
VVATSQPASTMRDPVSPDARYECLVKIASGGMGTVFVGRLRGRYGFTRLVAIKRAHPHLLDDASLRRSLIAEARVASRIHHPNVVSVLDIDETRDELLLVMDYVEGPSLSQLEQHALKREQPLPAGAVVRVILDVCAGLHAAHELTDEHGASLQLVHRDVSPQNVLVGADGVSRIADFGIAKSAESTQATQTGLRGKLAYMAPEYVQSRQLDRRVDVFALGVVAWEALANQRLFRGDGELETLNRIITHEPEPLSKVAPWLPPELDAVIARALTRDPELRTQTAAAFAAELEAAAKSVSLDLSTAAVATLVKQLYGDTLDARRAVLREQLASKGEPSSKVSALVAGRIEDPETQTASASVSIADARTVPLRRELSPPSGPRAEPEALAVSARATARRARAAPFVVAGLLGAGAAAFFFLRGPSSSSAGASATPSEAAVVQAATGAATPTAVAITTASAPSELAAEPHVAASTSASAHAGRVRTTHRPAAARPTATPTTAPPTTAKTARPGLGY